MIEVCKCQQVLDFFVETFEKKGNVIKCCLGDLSELG